MPYYIRLLRFTREAAQRLKDFKSNRAEFKKQAEKFGIKIIGEYVTLGRYDLITILEAPDEKAILKLHTTFAAPKGRVTSETLTAITADEFESILESS